MLTNFIELNIEPNLRKGYVCNRSDNDLCLSFHHLGKIPKVIYHITHRKYYVLWGVFLMGSYLKCAISWQPVAVKKVCNIFC